LLTSNNQITGFQVIARDITLEKEFKEQLIIAKTNAEKTAELKSRFLANMSHEIRTPLNGIIGIINLLENTTLSHKQQVYIQAILSSSNQLMGIINDVLDLSKIDAGKLVMESTAFDLYGLVDSVQTVFEVTTKDKGIQLICTVAQDIPQFVIGDPVRLNQILYNIIGNAVKFTDHGRVEVMLSLAHLEDKSCTILFQIRDTGVGMDEQVINKIFDSFTQAESDTTRKFGGTGLGLAIVKNLVKLLGGSIEVKSKQAIGSTFIIELPFLITHESLVEVKMDKKIDETIQLKGLSILVVEDNPINQLVTRDLLEEKEVRVAVASNGQIALDLMRETAFDLVLMDMQMPVLDGYQTMRLIRKMENGSPKHMPIIALTANAIESETQKCFEAGADAYVAKPFRPDYLFDEIQSLLHASDKKNMKNDTISIDMGTFSMFLNNNRPLMVKTLDQLITAFHDEESVLQNQDLAKDPIELRKVVHRMKPNFGIVGLTEWESFCKEIEGNEALTPAQSEVVIHRILGVIPSLVEAISNEKTKMKQVIQEKQVP
jgi:CheY-like chemotaxis protein/HPt (histidine-containing phosphotransfer) domain-containing protein